LAKPRAARDSWRRAAPSSPSRPRASARFSRRDATASGYAVPQKAIALRQAKHASLSLPRLAYECPMRPCTRGSLGFLRSIRRSDSSDMAPAGHGSIQEVSLAIESHRHPRPTVALIGTTVTWNSGSSSEARLERLPAKRRALSDARRCSTARAC
jgi:hypothetical protein